MNICNG